jgi:hypothetical protein
VYYNYDPSAAYYILTNPDGAWRRYNALQVTGTRRFAGRWSLDGSYTLASTRGSFDNDHASNGASSDLGPNGQFANPNRALNATGRTLYDRRHDLKLFGMYVLPYWGGVRVSGIYRFTSGVPYPRVVNSFGPLTGSAVIVEPVGTYEQPAVNNADVRVEKTFRVGRAATVGVYGDVFNVNNQGAPARINNISGPNFGLPRGWIAPRQLRAGFRVVW